MFIADGDETTQKSSIVLDTRSVKLTRLKSKRRYLNQGPTWSTQAMTP